MYRIIDMDALYLQITSSSEGQDAIKDIFCSYTQQAKWTLKCRLFLPNEALDDPQNANPSKMYILSGPVLKQVYVTNIASQDLRPSHLIQCELEMESILLKLKNLWLPRQTATIDVLYIYNIRGIHLLLAMANFYIMAGCILATHFEDMS